MIRVLRWIAHLDKTRRLNESSSKLSRPKLGHRRLRAEDLRTHLHRPRMRLAAKKNFRLPFVIDAQSCFGDLNISLFDCYIAHPKVSITINFDTKQNVVDLTLRPIFVPLFFNSSPSDLSGRSVEKNKLKWAIRDVRAYKATFKFTLVETDFYDNTTEDEHFIKVMKYFDVE